MQFSAASKPQNIGSAQVVPNFRIRSIPVQGTTPAIFGITAAARIICELAQHVLP